jgi:hypothetical protein
VDTKFNIEIQLGTSVITIEFGSLKFDYSGNVSFGIMKDKQNQ